MRAVVERAGGELLGRIEDVDEMVRYACTRRRRQVQKCSMTDRSAEPASSRTPHQSLAVVPTQRERPNPAMMQQHMCRAGAPRRCSRGSLSEPTSSPRYTCTESADMISPFRRSDSSRLASVLPTPVGPVRTSTLARLTVLPAAASVLRWLQNLRTSLLAAPASGLTKPRAPIGLKPLHAKCRD